MVAISCPFNELCSYDLHWGLQVIENQKTLVTSVVVIVVTAVTAVTQDLVVCQGIKNELCEMRGGSSLTVRLISWLNDKLAYERVKGLGLRV